MGWREEKRRTGRTTRMLEHAKQLASEGSLVHVIVNDHIVAQRLNHSLQADHPTITVSAVVPHEFRWETLSFAGDGNRTVVLVDHYVIERRFGHLVDMMNAYDEGHPHETATG